MRPRAAREIRSAFLSYFEKAGHSRIASASLIPAEDPTLLFTNAGMNQFKDVFTGREKRPYVRAVTSQRCVRAGGKHNDLESVGRTARHHTFFEMLGNFSFGDYFKGEAISFAWEFLTREMGLDADRLAFTVFQGGDGLPADDFARDSWPRITGLPAARVFALGAKDNFWAMGETGPCGPCSEIHFHLGDDLPCAEETAGRRCLGVACDCDRWLEIWNLVFMEFERGSDGKLAPLPKPSIDTGMGLERLAAVVQGVRSNFETDLLRPIMDEAGEILGHRYGTGEVGDLALRVLADHARASAYLVADGLVPSNEGRGYVLRRILRRAVNYGRTLGAKEPIVVQLIPRVFDLLGEAHPVADDRRAAAALAVRREEEAFGATIERGMRVLEEALAKTKCGNALPGEVVFTLSDTHGFPADLTALICRERGITVDEAGFEREMEVQRARSKGVSTKFAAKTSVDTGTLPATVFVGYDALDAEAKLLAEVAPGAFALDRTPFYAESGGQIGDRGEIAGDGWRIVVDSVEKTPGGVGLHLGRVEGTILPGPVRARVDSARRGPTERHHTATHLLHAALREVLGTHVGQAGSYVGPDRLRFDFTHPKPVTPEEILAVEKKMNAWCAANLAVSWQELPIEEARKTGAMAFFGEKYGEVVRVVSIGEGVSKEFCGGTHVRSTGAIAFVRVVGESAVASGIRRIEALAGEAGSTSALEGLASLGRIARRLSSTPEEAEARLAGILEERTSLEKEVARLKGEKAMGSLGDLLARREEAGGVAYVAGRLDGTDDEALRSVALETGRRLGSGVVVLAAAGSEGKVRIVVSVSKDLAPRLSARDLVVPIAEKVGGKGGGKPELAMAGGTRAGEIDAALALLPEVIRGRLSPG